MKGISTILAVILIVIIVVALISLTYTFAVGLFTTTTRGASAGAAAVTERLDKRVSIVAASCTKSGADWTIKFTIRHEGATYDIDAGDLATFWRQSPISPDPLSSVSLTPGQLSTEKQFSNTSAVNWAGSQTLTISSPAGTIDQILTCPA